MVEPNLEKFLPALIGMIGRVAGAAGGGDEEEEKSMDKQQIEKDWNPFKKKKEEPKSTPPDVKINPGERIGGPGDRIQVPMKKQHVEQALLKLMKGGSFYGGAREPKGGVAQGKLPAGNKVYGREEEVARQEAPLQREIKTKEEAYARRRGLPKQEPYVKPKEAMEKVDAPEEETIGELTTNTPGVKTTRPMKGYKFKEGPEGKAELEAWWDKHYPELKGKGVPTADTPVEEALLKIMKGGKEIGAKIEDTPMGRAMAATGPGQGVGEAYAQTGGSYRPRDNEKINPTSHRTTPLAHHQVTMPLDDLKNSMEKGDRDMPIQEHSDIKFRPGPQTHPEHTRIPTPEDPRTFSDIKAPEEESNGFGMGDLEERIANKARNKPTYGEREGTGESKKFREARHTPGRPKPEQGATPSFSASLKALNKMLEEGFISKKVDPAMAAQSRAANRQRGAATQERIAGQHAAGAQQVQGPADNAAQQAGQEIAGQTSWAAQQAWGETHGKKPDAEPGTPQYNQQQQEGDDDMPNVSNVDALMTHTKKEGKDAGVQDANTPGTSGLFGPTGAPLPASSTAPPTQDMTTTPKADPNKLNLPATGMMGPTTKPTAGNMPDLTNKPWKPANSA